MEWIIVLSSVNLLAIITVISMWSKIDKIERDCAVTKALVEKQSRKNKEK